MEKILHSIPLKNIKMNDSYWSSYIDLVRKVILPYQWEMLNDRIPATAPSHCIQNFRIAAGLEDGSFQGMVFQDTDAAKWLEAVAYTLESNPDEALEQLADQVIDLIGMAQQEDGYLDTYFILKAPKMRWKNLREGHELYTAGHMIEAAVAYSQATGKHKFLKIAVSLGNLLCRTFGPGQHQLHGCPGHQEIELALVKLYRATGTRDYLALAKYFIDLRGVGEDYFEKECRESAGNGIFSELADYDPFYAQTHLPVRYQTTAEGHAVRAVYMYCAMADLAYEYEDDELLNSCRTLWDNIVQKRMYITGSIGSSGIMERFTVNYDLPNDRNYSETCASIGLALFGLRMAQITRDASYMDVVEVILYNTLQASISLDGKTFFYVNPLEVWPNNCLPHTSMEHVKPTRQPWFGVACCPPNIARTLASLGQYIYFTDEDGIYVNLYISSDIDTKIRGENVRIQTTTLFPMEGKAKFTVEHPGEKEIKLAFRLPAYSSDIAILCEGKKVQSETIKGYAYIKGFFEHSELTVLFDLPVHYIRANPSVREDEGKVAVMAGPVVYCLEEIDNGKNLSSLYLDTSVRPQAVPGQGIFQGSMTIALKGKRIKTDIWKESQLYGTQELSLEPVELKAVPYGKWGNRATGEMAVWLKEIL